VLPLSHDEVVHGKGSLIGKMPATRSSASPNLRLLFAYMYAQPGKKLMFMVTKFGQVREWAHDNQPGSGTSFNMQLTVAFRTWVGQLNRFTALNPRCTCSITMRPVSSGGLQRQPHQHNFIAAQKREPERHRADRLQLHSNHPRRLPHRRPTGGYCGSY